MRRLISILISLTCLYAQDALADCSWTAGNVPSPAMDVTIPSRTALKKVSVGQEFARHKMTLWRSGFVQCNGSGNHVITASDTLSPSALPNVFETGIKGVGVKFCLNLNSGGIDTCTPFSFQVEWSGRPAIPSELDVVFVRTERDVGSGDLPMNLNVTWAAGGNLSLLVRLKGTTKLVNDVFFSGCEATGPSTNVQMGKPTTISIANGNIPEVPFNFDIRCDGLKPDTKAPVKVYFEGSSKADGMLELSDQGQPGVASGIGISLVSDKGIKLPFSKTRSIALDWDREIENGSVYRFTAHAKYAPTGGAIKAGKGDAALNFVLDYN